MYNENSTLMGLFTRAWGHILQSYSSISCISYVRANINIGDCLIRIEGDQLEWQEDKNIFKNL